jgi:hypothetical protein
MAEAEAEVADMGEEAEVDEEEVEVDMGEEVV